MARGLQAGLLGLLLAACATLPEPDDLRAAMPRVDAELRALEAEGFAGQVLIGLKGEALLLSGFGTMGIDDPRPVTADAVMPLASISKPFTASAIFALAAEGRLGLSEPIGDFLEQLDESYAPIPIENVLLHTAGLPAEIVNRQWGGHLHFEPIGLDVLLGRMQQFPPDHPPGRHFNYSNVGYSLAAAIIEAVSEQSFEDYLHGSLLITAGVSSIGFMRPGWTSGDLVSSRDGAIDHGHFMDQPLLEDGLGWNLRGSGDLLARPEGILAWWQAVRDGRWLSEPWLERWLKPQIRLESGTEFGYGLMFRDTRLGPSIGHTGSQLAFTSDLAWYTGPDLLIYVNSAHSDFQADHMRERLEQALLAH